MKVLGTLLGLLKNNKAKFMAMILSALVFIFILFPFDDLTDLITSQVSKLTNNSLYVQFDRLKMSLIPQPGVEMDQVFIESTHAPAISANQLVIAPSITGLIQQKPYGRISAEGFLHGNVDVHVSKGTRSDNGVDRQRLEISAQKISLQDVRDMANLPVLLKGQMNLTTTALADLTFQEQPDVDVDLSIKQFELPSSNVNTPMGPISLPNLKLSTVELKGRLSAGRFIIETGTIGKVGDELYGTITGNMGLTLNSRGGGGVMPVMGAYNFDIDLKTKKSFQERAGLFLSFIDAYKTPTAEGSRYKLRLSATNPMLPPSFSAAAH